MSNEFSLQHFSGQLPIFPLPNVVHFPQTLLPLHIFEKRYQTLLEDALEGERLIGMAVLKPGWEEKYAGNPDIYPVACLGSILRTESLADGRSNILLLGLKRVKVKEILKPLPYRTASVEILEDQPPSLSKKDQHEIQQSLLGLYSDIVIDYADRKHHFPTLSNAGLGLSELTDALAASLGFPIPELVELLGEPDVLTRATTVEKKMKQMLSTSPSSTTETKSDWNIPDIHLN